MVIYTRLSPPDSKRQLSTYGHTDGPGNVSESKQTDIRIVGRRVEDWKAG